MKRGITWIVLTCLMVTSLVLASCTTKTTTSTSTSTTTTKTTTTTKATTTTTTSTTNPPTTTATTATATGHWWDKLGTPQYGGSLTLPISKNPVTWDPYLGTSYPSLNSVWMEQPTACDWLIDPSVYDYTNGYTPPNYYVGFLASGWEFTDTVTYVLHMKTGIHFQNIAPANGREMTAADVVFHYNRLFGLGDGYTTVSPFLLTAPGFPDLISVTNPAGTNDVVFKWKTPNVISITGALQSPSIVNSIDCPEVIKANTNASNLYITDWHKQVGTGPFIISDYVSGSSTTVVANPSYWGHDERYPQNQLPYIQKVSFLYITDQNTMLAGLRTGKLDYLDQVSITDSNNLKSTNPNILQIGLPLSTIYTIDPRNDKAPFTDLRVREALQMAINIPEIASTYYQGAADKIPGTLTTYAMGDWSYQYSDWPQSLKDTYTYNVAGAKKLLADAGFATGFHTDVVVSNDFILTNPGLIEIVQNYFAAIGVIMEVRAMDPNAWLAFVQTNHSNDALAVKNQGMLGLNYEPNVQINRFKTGYRVNYNMVSDPNYDALVVQSGTATTIAAYKAVMQAVNKLVAEQHYSISICKPQLFTAYQPWVHGFHGQGNSLSATGSNSVLWFFQFGARFWITPH